MLYRVIIKSASGQLYYLTSGQDGQAVDNFTNSDSTEFSSYIEDVSQFHTFSTVDAANAAITSLTQPYNERATVLEFDSVDDRLPVRVYYRVAVKNLKEPLKWFDVDGNGAIAIESNTAFFEALEEALEFKNSLSGWDKRQSKVYEVRDYGAPDYDFDYSPIGTTKWFRCDDVNPTVVEL